MAVCTGITKKGSVCKRQVKSGSSDCGRHNRLCEPDKTVASQSLLVDIPEPCGFLRYYHDCLRRQGAQEIQMIQRDDVYYHERLEQLFQQQVSQMKLTEADRESFTSTWDRARLEKNPALSVLMKSAAKTNIKEDVQVAWLSRRWPTIQRLGTNKLRTKDGKVDTNMPKDISGAKSIDARDGKTLFWLKFTDSEGGTQGYAHSDVLKCIKESKKIENNSGEYGVVICVDGTYWNSERKNDLLKRIGPSTRISLVSCANISETEGKIRRGLEPETRFMSMTLRSLKESESKEETKTNDVYVPDDDGQEEEKRVELVTEMPRTKKQVLGQFYTKNFDYILQGLALPKAEASRVIEPFAGEGDLLEWLSKQNNELPVEAYDIDPKQESIARRDTLMNPPDYTNAYVITNPPYLARNKSEDKALYDLYKINDLYKCFLRSLVNSKCTGGIVIVPVGFFVQCRAVDVSLRDEFLSCFRIIRVNYFQEDVFADTSSTVVAFSFERSAEPLDSQTVEWHRFPEKSSASFSVSKAHKWMIGGHLYSLPGRTDVHIRPTIQGKRLRQGEQQTNLKLSALDSGTSDGRIRLSFDPAIVYSGKESARTFCTYRITGAHLTDIQQQKIAKLFNEFLEKQRQETWSLCLPSYRESKDYARCRIPFVLSYTIVLHLMQQLDTE